MFGVINAGKWGSRFASDRVSWGLTASDSGNALSIGEGVCIKAARLLTICQLSTWLISSRFPERPDRNMITPNGKCLYVEVSQSMLVNNERLRSRIRALLRNKTRPHECRYTTFPCLGVPSVYAVYYASQAYILRGDGSTSIIILVCRFPT